MSDRKPPPPPVDGVAFGRSAAKTIGFFVLNVLFLFVGVVLIWAKVTNQVFDLGGSPKHVTWPGLIIGIMAVLSAPAMAATMVRSLWFQRRLVVAADRLQMVERHGGQDVVVLQIPYANVAWMGYEVTPRERRVGIDLLRLADPDTYAKGENFEMNSGIHGRHLCIVAGYQGGPRAIGTVIERAFAEWADRQGMGT
jgi:hypothetical protein